MKDKTLITIRKLDQYGDMYLQECMVSHVPPVGTKIICRDGFTYKVVDHRYELPKDSKDEFEYITIIGERI